MEVYKFIGKKVRWDTRNKVKQISDPIQTYIQVHYLIPDFDITYNYNSGIRDFAIL